MRTTGAGLLEFDELKRLLARYVSSPLGRAELDKAGPISDRAALEENLAETGEAIEYLRAASRPQPAARGAAVRLRFDSLPDPAEALAKLRIEGACLEAKEIRELTELLDVASDIRQLLAVRGRALPETGGALPEHWRVPLACRGTWPARSCPTAPWPIMPARNWRACGATSSRQRKLIQESLERFLRLHREEDVLQEEFVTIRNERFVVPVIAGRQRKIEGVIHGSSGSGHTLFVEPLETIELNNDLVRLTEEELREVHRILREMTARLREYAGIDPAHAAAVWRNWNCCSPRPASRANSTASFPASARPARGACC